MSITNTLSLLNLFIKYHKKGSIGIFMSVLCGTINLYAAPQDHGRIFHDDNSSISIFLGRIILLFLFVCWVVAKLSSKTHSNQDNFSDTCNPSKDVYLHNAVNEICPKCNGNGYIYNRKTSYTYVIDHIECEHCKGFKHVLNPEAKKLLEQLYSEQEKEVEASQKRKEEEHQIKLKKEKEIEEQRNIIKAQIEAEGRVVYSHKECENKLSYMSLKLSDIRARFRELSLPKCDCNGNLQCPLCLGSGLVLNNDLMIEFEQYKELRKEFSILYNDFKRIYLDIKDYIPYGCGPFSKFSYTSNRESNTRKITALIQEVLKASPVCPECQGRGIFEVVDCEEDPNNGTYWNRYLYTFKQPCPMCKGAKWI